MTTAVLTEATRRIMDAITAELEVLRGEQAPPERYDPRTARVTPTGRPKPLGDAS
ncbi:hypothetical protein [Phycicoccus endophyticus]|uniref:hypothetical protein n=1 Tax=Phycicoccus endophyticus TaxID=1690220 RepID=UPI0030B80B02